LADVESISLDEIIEVGDGDSFCKRLHSFYIKTSMDVFFFFASTRLEKTEWISKIQQNTIKLMSSRAIPRNEPLSVSTGSDDANKPLVTKQQQMRQTIVENLKTLHLAIQSLSDPT